MLTRLTNFSRSVAPSAPSFVQLPMMSPPPTPYLNAALPPPPRTPAFFTNLPQILHYRSRAPSGRHCRDNPDHRTSPPNLSDSLEALHHNAPLPVLDYALTFPKSENWLGNIPKLLPGDCLKSLYFQRIEHLLAFAPCRFFHVHAFRFSVTAGSCGSLNESPKNLLSEYPAASLVVTERNGPVHCNFLTFILRSLLAHKIFPEVTDLGCVWVLVFGPVTVFLLRLVTPPFFYISYLPDGALRHSLPIPGCPPCSRAPRIRKI